MNAKRALLLAITLFLSVGFLPATQVTIGSGDETDNLPMYVNFHNSLSEVIYLDNEIGSTGPITALTFYADFYTEVPLQWVKVWLGTTDWNNMSPGWIPAGELTLAFDGLVHYPEGKSSVTLGLNTPYSYNGGNLVLLIQHPWEMDTFHSSNLFRCQSGISQYRTRKVVSDSTELDPNAPPAPLGGHLTLMFPKITLHFAAQPPEPEIFIQPDIYAFGEVLVNGLENKLISLFNTGLEPLQISAISISGSPYFSLLNLPALPATLSNGASVSFIAHYEPGQPGIHAATITVAANTSQAIHQIPVSGTGIDPTIYALPYSQNFDACEPPALPIDWGSYTEPAGSVPFVRTFADDAAPSQPNLVRMHSNTYGQGRALLIAPPLDTSIPVNSTQISFSAQANGSLFESAISVGVLSDPEDPLTFIEVEYIDIETSSWAEYTVQFFTYQGAGRYIAFELPQLDIYNSFKVDDITISLLAGNDLAATVVTGTRFPCVGAASGYQISIANHGNSLQDNYLVKLMRDDGLELGSAAGLPVGHGESVLVPVTWTPASEGVCRIYGQVILPGDISAANDCTPDQIVTVLASGTTAVTIGSGNEQARIPADLYRRNSLFETVFRDAQINARGTITGLQFYNDFFTSTTLNKPLKVWLGETGMGDLAAGWIQAGELQLVFDGWVVLRPGNDVVVIMLAEPYEYEGGNLAMLVNRPWDTEYYSSSDMFLCQSSATLRSRNLASDSIVLDPFDPPAPSYLQLSGQYPQTSFFLIPDTPVQDNVQPAVLPLNLSPNPFSGQCRISFTLREPAPCRLEIFNLRGQLVRSLLREQRWGGNFSCEWDGLDAQGFNAPSGIYLCRLRAGSSQTQKKLVRLP